MSDKRKFLILNPSSSNLEEVLKKANIQDSKNGPFEAVFLLGDSLPLGTPLPKTPINQLTYFVSGVSNPIDASSVSQIENLHYLGDIGIMTSESGVTIGYISDATTIEAKTLTEIFEGKKVDILISYHWTQKIGKQNKLTLVGDKNIDNLVKMTHPRYHFAVGTESGRFYEHGPFSWEEDQRITRFISLGQEGTKDKWFYAFGMPILAGLENPSNLIENPFLIEEVVEPSLEDFEAPSKPSEDSTMKRVQDFDGSDEVIRKRRTVLPDKCFFCLSNPNLETHMIIAIGETCYLTIAKGPLSTPKDDRAFSGHAIIIPIAHIPTPRVLLEESEYSNVLQTPLVKEIMRFQIALIKLFKNSYDSSLVFFEINRDSSVHYHVQLLPVATELLEDFEGFLRKQEGLNNEKFDRNQKLSFIRYNSDSEEEMTELNKIQNSSDYVMLTIAHSVEKQIHYACALEKDRNIDLQFPRRVLAHVLKNPKRTYWDKCKQSVTRESKESELFKEAFKEYDFTLE